MTDKQPEPEYIISEEQLQIWRQGCINLKTPRTDGEFCQSCEYRGKGLREKCCDFDDVSAEKIFRSHLLSEHDKDNTFRRMVYAEKKALKKAHPVKKVNK